MPPQPFTTSVGSSARHCSCYGPVGREQPALRNQGTCSGLTVSRRVIQVALALATAFTAPLHFSPGVLGLLDAAVHAGARRNPHAIAGPGQ